MHKTREMPSPEEAIRILQESRCPPNVICHCKTVAKLAVRIANKCKKNGVNINVQLIHIGALLHDLGRSETHTVHHGVVGAEIARSFNLSNQIISIIERHVGGGITAKEASTIGLPKKNYIPKTLEEKIVSYADKLIEGNRIVPITQSLQKFREELGATHPVVKRVADLHEEISNLFQKSDD